MRTAVLSVLALCVSSSAAAEEVLAGCKVSPVSGGIQFTCDGLIGSSSEFPNLGVKAAMESQLAGIKSAIKGEMTESETTFTEGKKSWKGVKLSVKRPGEEKASFEGTMLGTDKKGTARLSFCGAATSKPAAAERCRKILPALVESGPAPYLKAPAAPKFAGKEVVIPKDCKTIDSSEKHFRIGCGESAFVAALTLADPKEMAAITATLKEQLIKGVPGASAGADRECKVGGVKTTCSVVNAGDGNDGAVFLLGAAMVAGSPVSVQCAHSTAQGIHPICAGMLDL